MGYRPPTTGQKLDFAGTPYEGLEVTVDAAPLGLLLEMTEMFALAQGERSTQDAIDATRGLVDKFSAVLESWNLEHPKTGEPVPATREGLLSQDIDFVMEVIGAWVTRTVAAEEDLGKDSPSGGTSAEASIPMEPLSPSPPS